MREIKIYLAGAMVVLSYEESNKWRNEVLKFAEEIRACNEIKITTVNPNDYFNFKDNPPRYESDKEVMNFDLHKLRKCDLVIADLRYISQGTDKEIMHAYDNNIPVLGWYDEENNLYKMKHPWNDVQCERIFSSLNKCLEYISDLYIL